MKKYIFALVLITFFLRIWNGQEFFFWNIDEEILAQTSKRILIDHRPQLLGFPIPGGIYLGPLIYYVISLFYALAFMDPAILPVFSSAIAAFTVILIYIVGKNLFGTKVGFISAYIYSMSYLTNAYSRLFTGLTFVPIVSLLTYYSLYKIITTRQKKYFLILGPTLIFASQNEGSSLSLIILTLFVWLIYRFPVGRKKLFVFSSLLVIAQLPLALFDFRHNHFAIKSFLNFFSNNSSSSSIGVETYYQAFNFIPNTISRLIVPTGTKSIADQILPCSQAIISRAGVFAPLLILSFFILAFYCFYVLRRKELLGARIVLIHLLIIVFGIGAYNLFSPGYLFEWMLTVFFPGFCFIISFFLVNLKMGNNPRKYLVAAFLVLFAIPNIYFLKKTDDMFGLGEKRLAVKYAIDKLRGHPFELQSKGSCYQNGYVYLFWQMGHAPVKSYEDQRFSSTLNLNPGNISPEYKVLIVHDLAQQSEDFKDEIERERQKAVFIKKQKGIETIISQLII